MQKELGQNDATLIPQQFPNLNAVNKNNEELQWRLSKVQWALAHQKSYSLTVRKQFGKRCEFEVVGSNLTNSILI